VLLGVKIGAVMFTVGDDLHADL